MKRYRVLRMELDARANWLNMEIQDTWEPEVQAAHRASHEQIRAELLQEFGELNSDSKLQNFVELGSAPLSIVAFHNRFLRQTREAFVVGSYYPALTAACALGERILNQLILTLRDDYQTNSAHASVATGQAFESWPLMISALEKWDVLLPDVVQAFHRLTNVRNAALHYHPGTDRYDRRTALKAVKLLSEIIHQQFGAFGLQPWFIPNTPGASFITKDAEQQPFIKHVYLPNCAYVGPHHKLELEDLRWRIIDMDDYEDTEIPDEEFALRFNQSPH